MAAPRPDPLVVHDLVEFVGAFFGLDVAVEVVISLIVVGSPFPFENLFSSADQRSKEPATV